MNQGFETTQSPGLSQSNLIILLDPVGKQKFKKSTISSSSTSSKQSPDESNQSVSQQGH